MAEAGKREEPRMVSAQKPFASFTLNLAASGSQLRPAMLDVDQQRRLAFAWSDVWASGHLRGAPERIWQVALGYIGPEWDHVRDRFELVLLRPDGSWGLPFMFDEADRQSAMSAEQSRRRSIGNRRSPTVTDGHRGSPTVTAGSGSGSGCKKELEPSPQTHAADDSRPDSGQKLTSQQNDVRSMVAQVARSARMPVQARPRKNGHTPENAPANGIQPKGGAPAAVLASAQDLARPLGSGGIRTACQLVNYVHKRGVTHPGLLLAITGHWVTNHDRIREPFAYYNPGAEGWEQVRLVLAARHAEAEHAAMMATDREWAESARR